MKVYMETAYGSLIKHGEELCGDKIEVIKNPRCTIAVLADGLGSGVKANILASLTSKIVASMLDSGAEISDVIETLASTLPVCKVRNVAYSTFTFMRMDSQGLAHIVEFDNPGLVLMRSGKCVQLPYVEHIIAERTIKEAKIELLPDDLCIMFSDGVIHAGVGKLLNLGWQYPNVVSYLENAYRKDMTPPRLVNLMLSACNNLYMQSPGDDTTVVVCKVRPALDPRPDFAYYE